MAQTGKEDPESRKMLYFEIIMICNDYVGLVSVTWENAAPVAGVGGGCSAPEFLFLPPLQDPLLL